MPQFPGTNNNRTRDTATFAVGGDKLFIKWLFVPIFSLISYCRRYNLNPDEMELVRDLKARDSAERAENLLFAEFNGNKKNPSCKRVLDQVFDRSHLFTGVWRIMTIAFTYLATYFFLFEFLRFIERYRQGKASGDYIFAHLIALGMFLSLVLSSVSMQQLALESTRVGVQVRSAIQVLTFRKSLRLAQVRTSISDVINLIADDCNRIAESILYRHYLWSSALEVLVILALAFVELRLSALPAVGIVILLLPVQYKLGRLISKYALSASKYTNKRVHRMSELLTSMKLIKFFAWEVYFRNELSAIREKELAHIRNGMCAKVVANVVEFVSPVLLTLVCLYMNRALFGEAIITAPHVFTVLALFNAIKFPLVMLKTAVKAFSSTSEAYKRFDAFFAEKDAVPQQTLPPPENNPTLRIFAVFYNINWQDNADFEWENSIRPAVSFLNLKVRTGEIVTVVGDVGAGKSSLLSSLIGQLRLTNGICEIYSPVAYVPSEPWIINDTVKANITFGYLFEQKKYNTVIRACGLLRDIESLSRGDETEVGERGIILSQVQRQKVSIARAVYSGAEIILLDDPLRAMETSISTQIFDECFREILNYAAIILVTNQANLLEKSDLVMLMKNGTCFEQGTYEELRAKNFDFASFIGENITIEHDPYIVDDLLTGINFDDNETAEPESLKSETMEPEIVVPEIVVPEIVEPEPIEPEIIEESEGNAPDNNKPTTAIKFATVSKPSRHLSSNTGNDNLKPPLNSQSTQRSKLNENTVSKYFEQRQLSVIDGYNSYATVNQATTMSRMIERNQLTIHSLHGVDMDENDSGNGEDSRKDRKISSLRLYRLYSTRATGAWLAFALLVFFLLVHGVRICIDFWLEINTRNTSRNIFGLDYFLIYGILVVAFGAGLIVRGFALVVVLIRKCRSFHNKIFIKILRAPMSYLEYKPIGKMVAIFARHQNYVDNVLTDAIIRTLANLPLIVGVLIAIFTVMPFAALISIVILAVWWTLFHFAQKTEVQLRRLEMETRPLLFGHLFSALEGLHSVRTYNAEGRFDSVNLHRIDKHNKVFFTSFQVQSWLSLYLDLTVAVFVYVVLLIEIFGGDIGGFTEKSGGIALTNALQLLIFGSWTINSIRDIHNAMKSVGELVNYVEEMPSEAPMIIKDNRPPPSWPSNGEIEFKDAVFRYHRYGIAVLKNVSILIRPREKVGIVGRTGSGKTTLLVSLLRTVELAEGEVTIDGIDISTIGLKDLRSNIAVLPQEPVLFDGTIRSNLDPFSSSTDDEIWTVLRSVHLFEKIRNLPLQLEAQIIENGKIFSLGQRQLFCIARAILAKCKILLLDEATNAVDIQTDILIQETIRRNFSDCTVITIAQRLNTIIDSDRILVMDNGRVVEFDTPKRLLSNKNGFFSSLVARSGEDAARKLTEHIFGRHSSDGEESSANAMPPSLGTVFQQTPS